MSGSPKYTSVRVSPARQRRDQLERARRAAERRQRQVARAARQRELAARQRAKAQERARRDREREARQLQASLQDRRNAVSSRLDGIRALLDDAGAGPVQGLRAELDNLRARVQTGTDLAGYERAAEALRSRAVDLRRGAASPVTPGGQSQLISNLRQRISVVPHEDTPADQRARCDQLIGQLEAAAGEPSGVRFEALLGTAEQAVASLEWRAQQAAQARRPPAAAVPPQTAPDEPAGEDELTGQDELEHATARLALIREATQGAIADAAAFGETGLGSLLQDALHAAAAAVSAGQPAEASARVGALEELLTSAEATLDDSQAAHERRTDLAAALQDLLADHGMTFLGGSDEGSQFLLQFERPSGAVYTATISDAEDGGLSLSYAIDGEQDVPVLPEPGEAVCDQTEGFLEAVHASLAGSGFEAGELLWDGKPTRRQPLPPGSRARPLPASEPRSHRD